MAWAPYAGMYMADARGKSSAVRSWRTMVCAVVPRANDHDRAVQQVRGLVRSCAVLSCCVLHSL